MPAPLQGLMALGAGGLLAMTLSACYGGGIDEPFNPNCVDETLDSDGDGYCGSFDCNEADFSVNDGAFDELGDGIDTNCDGVDGFVGDAG